MYWFLATIGLLLLVDGVANLLFPREYRRRRLDLARRLPYPLNLPLSEYDLSRGAFTADEDRADVTDDTLCMINRLRGAAQVVVGALLLATGVARGLVGWTGMGPN